MFFGLSSASTFARVEPSPPAPSAENLVVDFLPARHFLGVLFRREEARAEFAAFGLQRRVLSPGTAGSAADIPPD
jgi:hypothetical protein